MNALERLFSDPRVVRFGLALVHFLWQGLVVAAALAVVLWLLRRRSANLRYLVATVGLFVLAVMPMATFLAVDAPAPVASEETTPAIAAVDVEGVPETVVTDRVPVAVSPPPVPAPVEPVMTARDVPGPPPVMAAADDADAPVPPAPGWYERTAALVAPYLPHTVAGWMLGVCVLVLWRLAGWTQVRRLTRRDARPVSKALRERFAELAARLRVWRPVRLLESGIAAVPTVVGALRPVVLLPVSALTGLSGEQIEAILAHELADTPRRDARTW